MTTIAFTLMLVIAAKDGADVPPPVGVLVPVPHVIRDGDVLQLYLGDGRGWTHDVAAASSHGGFRDLQKFIMAGDHEGVAELVRDDHVAMLPSGTRVRVLKKPYLSPPEDMLQPDPEYRGVEVRLLEGPKAGQQAFVVYEQVRLCRTVYPKAKRRGRR